MKRLLAVTIVLLALLAIVAGCGRAAQPTPKPTATPAAAQATATPAPAATVPAAPTAAPVGPAKQGGVFRRLWADPPTLDPHLVTDTTSSGLVVEIFSGLVTFSPDLKLEPDLAERWEMSQDGKSYTFYLRRNAKFQDGKPVTANDIKYSLERAADPRTGSPVADTYLGNIIGVKDKLDGKAKEISGVRVIDERTIRLQLDAPKVYFLATLTYPTGFVVDRENVERGGRNWTQRPNGTGPFKLAEYRIGERLVLERNPNYYLEPARLDRVEFILSGGSSMAMYENNEIDVTGVGLADLDRVRNPKDPLNKDLVVAPPGFNIWYVGFNVNMPPFDDLKVRQALNYAINKELISQQVLAGLLTPAYGILPPGFPGYTGKVEGIKFDPNKAKQLLSESKYAGRLPRIVLTVPGTGGSLGLDLEVIIEMWKQLLGINVEIQQVEWATFLQDLNNRKLQIYSGLGWEADYPDPQDFLDILFHGKSQLNHMGYSNPELDKLLEEARVAQDWNLRVQLYQKAEQIILSDAPWVPLWYEGEGNVLIKPHVKGYRLTPMIVPKMRYVWIEKS